MIDVESLSVIRHSALQDKMPIRNGCAADRLSRNTFKTYLRARIVESQFQTPERPSNLDTNARSLSGWLVTEQGKSPRNRHTARQMHVDLDAP